MKKTTDVEITARALEFLSSIDTPVLVDDFIRLELTGNPTADNLLSNISRMMLEQLRRDGMIKSDDFAAPRPKVYGLTHQGIEMHQLFRKLTTQ